VEPTHSPKAVLDTGEHAETHEGNDRTITGFSAYAGSVQSGLVSPMPSANFKSPFWWLLRY
jgi:hypothetical protein